MKNEELKIEAYPPQPKGGQQVGVSCLGVRITHIPTGLEAASINERSQIRNKRIALSMLECGLAEIGWK